MVELAYKNEAVDGVREFLDQARKTRDALNSALDPLDDVVAEDEDLPQRGVQLLWAHRRWITLLRTCADVVDALHLARKVLARAARELEQHVAQVVRHAAVHRAGLSL